MRRGLLLIDRGSRESEVQNELSYLCTKVKEKGGYLFANYCFLEVIPPFIDEAIEKCLKEEIDALTIVPYFLYPGKKVKAAVNKAVSMQSRTKVKLTISKPMSLHKSLIDLADEKIESALKRNSISLPKEQIDVLIIGHGSKDPNARMSIIYVADGLKPQFRNVNYCFLEIEEPNISQGLEKCTRNFPEVLVVMFYFLHEGAHVKRDVHQDLKPAIEKSKLKKVFVTEHLGINNKMVDLIIERAREVEK